MDRKTATVDSGSCAAPPVSWPKTGHLVGRLFGIGLIHGLALLFASALLDQGVTYNVVGAGVLSFWAVVLTMLIRCRFRLGERERRVVFLHPFALTLFGSALFAVGFVIALIVRSLLEGR